jgi:MFS family permease
MTEAGINTVSTRLGAGMSRTAVAQALATFNWSASLRSVYDTLCPVTFFIFANFALALGIQKEQMGVFTAVTSLACLAQVVTLLVINRICDRKRFVVLFGIIETSLVSLGVLTAFMLHGVAARFAVLVGLIGLAAAASFLTRPLTDEWLATVIPERVRGRYLARRQQITSAVMVTVSLLAGLVNDRITHARTMDHALGYLVILLGGGVFGLLAITMLNRAPMPASSESSQVRWTDIFQVFRHRPFILLVLGNLLIEVPFFIGCPYYAVFNLKVLHLSGVAISVMGVGYYLLKIVLSPLLGRWVDAAGPRRTLWWVVPLYLLSFSGYAFSTAAAPWPVFVGWTLAGIADGAYMVALNSGLFTVVPPQGGRQAFFAAYNLITFLANSLIAALGVKIVYWLKDRHADLGSFHFGQFHLLFLLCAGLLAVCMAGTALFPGARRETRTGHTGV